MMWPKQLAILAVIASLQKITDSHKAVTLGNKIKPNAVSSSPNVIIHALSHGSTSPTSTIGSNITYTLVLTDPDATSRAEPVKAEMCHWIVTGLHLNTTYEDGVIVHLPIPIEDIVDTFRTHVSNLKGAGHRSNILEESCAHPCGYNGQLCCKTSETCVVSGALASCINVSCHSNSKPKEIMSYFPPSPPPKTGYHRYTFVLLAPKSNEEEARTDSDLKEPKERPHWGYGKVGKGVRQWAKDNALTPVGANFFYAKNKKQ
ncbi:MAG: hypothetical protein L6R39_000163 [Caloplaca ligustica]|nr:MAG: hypothetical protein L6R39_000163 [Caloplaca ligustica]